MLYTFVCLMFIHVRLCSNNIVLFVNYIQLYENFSEQEILTARCLAALQECVRRFPEHYKSLYRLAYFYFRSKLQRDPTISKQLLLGEKGLFKDRRPNNFFNVSCTTESKVPIQNV